MYKMNFKFTASLLCGILSQFRDLCLNAPTTVRYLNSEKNKEKFKLIGIP